MIGKLQGIIDFIGDGFVILMTGGVGYKVFVPSNLNLTLGSSASLWIETIVREDSFRLFGFDSIATQNLFNKLTGVSGVGPRVAIAIVGALRADILLTAIVTGDAKTITAAPGVGKKVAEKIIVELKGKTDLSFAGAAGDNNNLADLISALESLGYRRIDIVPLAQKLCSENQTADTGELVRIALKEISNK
ncbi:MAG: Holliday junction branch migration protein RuvA [Rickettsiales bacterium]|jgi:Holliday junction DNA helicase RuvA|nr:Holliday junction branch migration protein RuvA [Rickettsiales bacterium]